MRTLRVLMRTLTAVLFVLAFSVVPAGQVLAQSMVVDPTLSGLDPVPVPVEAPAILPVTGNETTTTANGVNAVDEQIEAAVEAGNTSFALPATISAAESNSSGQDQNALDIMLETAIEAGQTSITIPTVSQVEQSQSSQSPMGELLPQEIVGG